MNDATLAIGRKIKASGSGEYVFLPSLTEALGRCSADPHMATLAANACVIAFGDFELVADERAVLLGHHSTRHGAVLACRRDRPEPVLSERVIGSVNCKGPIRGARCCL
jgi:hypothetical protein